MQVEGKLFIGAGEKPEYLTLRLANRHGLITGATGTGKTVTLQGLAEAFSEAGVPVFAADVKGDLAGLAAKGEPKDFLLKRAEEIGLTPYVNDDFPVIFWDIFGQQGAPVRTTISEMGPLLLARLLNLNDVQEGVLNIAFRVADQEGLLLLDLKDLQALLNLVGQQAGELTSRYGNVSKASIGAIQRQLLVLENQGGALLFGEPALQLTDLMRTTRDGRGTISILAADRLMQSPRLYATFLLWLLSELFEQLPEIGDPDKPKLVFFFDEAHLLFDEAPAALIDKIEQVVRLIRSKGVGVYFVTQNPLDVPDTVSSQLGNRIQHALRAYTPREQKAVRAAASTFRQNPAFNTEEAITQLNVGEALVSTLEDKGAPSMVARTLIRPPASRLGPLTAEERQRVIQNGPVAGHYDVAIDRESAHEVLQKRAEASAAAVTEVEAEASSGVGGLLNSIFGTGGNRRQKLTPAQSAAREVTRTVTNRVAGDIAANIGRSVAGSMGGSLGRAIVRGALGSLLRR
ncbi:helicase HerA-like domain-containing protein [Terrihabitans rhizophilus]|uniref:Helicase HerA-like domain-containing protein n=1 Tax=Terrihabitans rhizophilus TaxID=3092662 RepID=A0ABU4RNX4_9HYPH|nr:helicase HerA-like domain-containing protein [Terrihabitans sp. PJ23]MDX6806539.1 helicase HerA-like domain-containing protein [Terrihabitans sp. PJ23]